MHVEVPLTQGKIALVDIEDMPRVSKHSWCAKIHVKGKGLYLGLFSSEEDAALAYNIKAVEHFGEFACVNRLP